MPKTKSIFSIVASCLLVVSIFLPLAQAQPARADSSLIGYWNLDDNSGTTAADSAGSNNATLHSSPNWVTGRFGYGLNFDSGSYANTSLAWPSSSGTLSVWAYPTSEGSWVSPAGWKQLGGNNGYVLFDEGGSGSQWRAVFNPNITNGFGESSVVASGSVTMNQWNYLVMTWSLSGSTYTMKFYLNGVYQGTTTWTGTPGTDGLGGLNFGKSGDYPDNYFSGNIDDVRVYNRTLSQGEITAFANQAPSPSLETPTSLGETAIHSTAITLTWTAGLTGGPAVTGYHVQYKKHTDSTWLDWSTDPVGPSATVTGLSTSMNYDFKVSQTSSLGTSAYSSIFSQSTNAETSISTCNQLQAIQNSPGLDYILTTDIHCEDTINWSNGGFQPITGFSGSLNGQGHTIFGLYENTGGHSGLFLNTANAVITNLTIDAAGVGSITGIDDSGVLIGDMASGVVSNVTINEPLSSGGENWIGAIAGRAYCADDGGNISISNIAVNSDVTFSGGSWGIGGVIGYLDAGNHSNCTVNVNNVDLRGNVTATDASLNSTESVGGLAGELDSYNNSATTVSNVTVSGNVVGGAYYGGGVVGFLYEEDNAQSGYLKVIGAHSTGNVSVGSLGDEVGGLAGEMDGPTQLINSSSSGTITGPVYVGGLVGAVYGDSGINMGVINGSNSSAQLVDNTTGGTGSYFGGLVGAGDYLKISDSYANDNFSSGGTQLGGLVGELESSTISNSYATGHINATTGATEFGGLVGENDYGSINASYNSAKITGSADYLGGLVGVNVGDVVNSYSNGALAGNSYVGGLVGQNQANIIDSYAISSVTGSANIGGLVGDPNSGTITNSYWNTDVAGPNGCGTNNNCIGLTGETTAVLKTKQLYPQATSYSLQDVSSNAQYRYIKWEITQRKNSDNPGCANSNACIQVGELALTLNGTTLAWPNGASATNPGGDNIDPNSYGAPEAIDGNVATKWFDRNFNNDETSQDGDSVLIVDAGQPVTFNGYTWATADDTPARDPGSWSIYGSNDNSTWTLLDGRSQQTITDARKIYAPTGWDFTNTWSINCGYPFLAWQNLASDCPTTPSASSKGTSAKVAAAIAAVAGLPVSLEPASSQTDDYILLNDFDDYASSGHQLSLSVGQVVHFQLQGTDHTATVKQIGDGFVVFAIASTPFDVTVKVGQTVMVDVNKDGHNDISIKLKGITDGLADVTFKQLLSPVAVSPTQVPPYQYPWLWVAILSLIAIGLSGDAARRQLRKRLSRVRTNR